MTGIKRGPNTLTSTAGTINNLMKSQVLELGMIHHLGITSNCGSYQLSIVDSISAIHTDWDQYHNSNNHQDN